MAPEGLALRLVVRHWQPWQIRVDEARTCHLRTPYLSNDPMPKVPKDVLITCILVKGCHALSHCSLTSRSTAFTAAGPPHALLHVVPPRGSTLGNLCQLPTGSGIGFKAADQRPTCRKSHSSMRPWPPSTLTPRSSPVRSWLLHSMICCGRHTQPSHHTSCSIPTAPAGRHRA